MIDEKCRVAFLIHSLSQPASGVHEVVRQMLCGFEKNENVVAEAFGYRTEPLPADGSHTFSITSGIAASTIDSGSLGISPELPKVIETWSPSVIHTHGVWTFLSLASKRASVKTKAPLLVSPHGMFEPWAIKHSRLKKVIARVVYEQSHMNAATCFHALHEGEMRDIWKLVPQKPVCVIPNGVNMSDYTVPEGMHFEPPWQKVDTTKKTLLFLGRLHPKKGVGELLEALTILKGTDSQFLKEWSVKIVGCGTEQHMDQYKSYIESNNLETIVELPGPLYGSQKVAAFHCADAFILPSKSEGMPVAVLESWSCSCPVLITQACNLTNELETGTGMLIPEDAEGISDSLEALSRVSQVELKQRGNRGKALVEKSFTWDVVLSQYIEVYQWMLGKGSKPTFVYYNVI